MPRGYRLLVATLGGIVLLLSFGLGLYIAELNYPDEQRHQPYRYAADKPLEIDPAAAGRADAKPFEYRSPCAEPKGHDESDLCAQWRAAKAAEDSAFWAKWGFWIAIAGTGALIWQIILTRQAVEDTSEATEAMREANRIAEETSHAQMRPWVTLWVEPKLIRRRDNGFDIRFDIACQNLGETGAKNIQVRHKAEFGDPDNPDQIFDIWDNAKPAEHQKRPTVLMPDEMMRFPSYAGFAEDVIPWRKSRDEERATFVVVVSVFYRFEFSPDWHRTDRAYIVGLLGDGSHIPRIINTQGEWGAEEIAVLPYSANLGT